jgi:hypothetical protein
MATIDPADPAPTRSLANLGQKDNKLAVATTSPAETVLGPTESSEDKKELAEAAIPADTTPAKVLASLAKETASQWRPRLLELILSLVLLDLVKTATSSC